MSLLQCIATKYGLGSHSWEDSSTQQVKFYKVGVSFPLIRLPLGRSVLIQDVAIHLNLRLLLGLQYVRKIRSSLLLPSHNIRALASLDNLVHGVHCFCLWCQ